MKGAVIYSRVSTQGQAQEGVSLDAQVNRARLWAAGNQFEIIGEYQDAGISGKRADNRPGLQAAIDHACKSGAALVVYSLSRLARSTRDCIDMAEALGKAGADLVSLSENLDTTSAAGKAIFKIFAVMAEMERDLIAERTKGALDYKHSQGFKTGGAVPFGYDANPDGRLIENPAEQEAIKLIRELRAQGFTLAAIGEDLERRNIKTKNGGMKWSPKVVRALALREAA